jgi:tetratricopeptide (TPR) repeat protein
VAEQIHSGSGDNIAGNQTKIDRQANLGAQSIYVEQQNIYGEHKIPHILTAPPFIPEIFEGREDDLQTVHIKLLTGDNLLLLVNGEGGIGKTTLAAKYWQRYESDYHHVAWVFSQKSLLGALLTLAVPLNIEFPAAMPAQERFEKLLMVMANLPKPCLLIIDNANNIKDLEENYLALHSCPNFHLLLTTRITAFEQAEIYRITPLDEADALVVFKKHYPKHKDHEDDLLRSIRTAVGGNTLVMELLAKNLAAVNTDEIFYSLNDLLQDLQKKGLLELTQSETVRLPEKGSHFAFKKVKPADVIATLYDEMEMIVPLTEAEQKLLSNLAVFPAENLPFSLLKALLTPEDVREFSRILTGLAQRGWIEKSIQKNGSYYKVSPVVQEITRYKNKVNLFFHCQTLIYNLIEKLKYQAGIGHFLSASYEEAAIYSRYSESLISYFAETDYNLSLLCDSTGNYCQTTGNLEKALKYYGKYNSLAKELFKMKPDDAGVKDNLAISCAKLGTIQMSLGNSDQAREFYQEYNRLEKELYEAFPDNVEFKNNLAISCGNLGTIQMSLGNSDQAREFYQEYNRLEKELYEAFPDNVEFKNNLAISCEKSGTAYSLLNDLGRELGFYQDYNRLEKELVEAFPDNLAFKNNLAISCGNLGITYDKLGDLQQALKFYQNYHRLEKELYKAYPNNVSFKNGLALSYQWLGWTYEKLENKTQAGECYEQSKILLEQLINYSPLNVEFKKNLDWVADRLNGD